MYTLQTPHISGSCEFLIIALACFSLSVIAFFVFFFRKKCAALNLAQEHYRSLAESAFEGIVLSRNGVVTDCNERVLEITGYTREQLCGQSIYNIFPEEYHELVRRNIATGYSDP